jgi:hypothetical protein
VMQFTFNKFLSNPLQKLCWILRIYF